MYVGLAETKCHGLQCPNYEAPVKVQTKHEYGSWEWARRAQEHGYVLEWKLDGSDWEALTEDLANDDESDDSYTYRLRQSYYEFACAAPAGSLEWAIWQEERGAKVRDNGKLEWEIVLE